MMNWEEVALVAGGGRTIIGCWGWGGGVHPPTACDNREAPVLKLLMKVVIASPSTSLLAVFLLLLLFRRGEGSGD